MKILRYSLALAALAIGCSTAAPKPDREPVFTELDRSIAVAKTESFTLRLASNPSTGYRWTWAKPLDNTILELGNESYVAGDPNMPGAAGFQEWRFRAVDGGSALVSLKYVRPWEKDTAPIRTHDVIVTVK